MSLLARTLRSEPRQLDVGLLVLRLWFGLVLAFGHGAGKLGNIDGFTAGVVKMGLPLPSVMAWAAILAELGGGLLLALGLLTRLASVPVIVTMFVAAFVRHAGDPWMKKEFALAYGVVALVLLIAGPGRLSVDHRLAERARS